jgi:hypothetical protein
VDVFDFTPLLRELVPVQSEAWGVFKSFLGEWKKKKVKTWLIVICICFISFMLLFASPCKIRIKKNNVISQQSFCNFSALIPLCTW